MKSGRITRVKMRLLWPKKEKTWKPKTINSHSRKQSRCCACLHRICDRVSQGNQERDCGYGMQRWESSRGINRIRLDGDEWFWARAGWWGTTCRRSSVRNQIDIRQSGRSVQRTQDCFWLLYGTDRSVIWALKQRQVLEGGLIIHRNIFREMKTKNLWTKITMDFHKGTPSVSASPAFPSTSSVLPSVPLIKVRPSSSSFSSAYSARRCREWRHSWWSTSTQWVANNLHAIWVINSSAEYVCECLCAESY